jgi:hypothetical protein
MTKLLEKFRAWRRRHEQAAEGQSSKDDWMTVGKSFRATDVVFDKNLPISSRDEGRPPH